MRRSLSIVGVVVLALLCIAPAGWAAESISSGAWSGSALDAGPGTVAVGSYRLSGTFRRSSSTVDRQISVDVTASPAGTGACSIAPVALPSATTPRAFGVTLTIPCNGTYTLAARAATTDNNVFFGPESVTLDRKVVVAAPAPKVTGVDANGAERTVTVTWDDMTGAAPDLSAYVVERKIGDGVFEEQATLDADVQSYEDAHLPAKGGDATYRIFATRPSPTGDKVSAASDSATTTFADAPPGSTSTTTDPSSGSGGPGGPSGGSSNEPSGTGGAGEQAGTAGGSRAGGSRAAIGPPRVFSGTFLPPLLRPASQTISTTTTLDTGFNESLPYEPGAENPVLPKDAMASIVTDGQPGRGMAIPVATALVLAIWAIHLRMLARAARPLD